MTPALQASHDFCRRLARREARNFYGSFLLLPAPRRRAMCALYGFMRHTDDLADAPGHPSGKAEALARWRSDVLDALAARDPADAWPGLPALADAVHAHAIPVRSLVAVIDGVELDLVPRPFASWAELQDYCDLVASAVGLCCLSIWGYRSDGGRAERLAESCGRALQLTNILRDVGEDARNGRIYLPADDRARFGVGPDDLLAARTTPGLRALIQFESDRAERLYAECAGLVDLVDPAARPALRAIVGVYHALLREIVRRDGEVLAERVRVPGWRKLLIFLGSLRGGRPVRVAVPPPPLARQTATETTPCR